MALILDTNAVSAVLGGDAALDDLLAETDRHHLPTVVIGEYRYGLQRSRRRDHLEDRLVILIADSVVLPIDLVTTIHYARVHDELRRQGTPIPENDIWIAALARQHGLPIVTRDRHLDRVPGLLCLGW